MTDINNDRPPLTFQQEDLSGKEIAGCKISHKLGQGAMGAVYLAEQSNLRRTVAVKVLDPKFSRDLTYIERFEREARSAARLTHYNIVQVFDYGRVDDLYYIVNEYVDGGNVQSIIDAEGCIPPETAIDIVLQSARGLAVAQEQSVVHRDIKPENLMLTKAGVVKIADFGLAKVVKDDATVTQSGMIVGTPFYMSPEQAKGLELDGRSDVYSLGVSFYHMTVGQLPFDAESVIGVLLKQISAERPDPCVLNPSLPQAMGQVIVKMMARRPEDRYQTARELVPVLESLRDQVKHGATGDAIHIPSAPVDRSERYKKLGSSQIIMLDRRTVSADVAEKMRLMIRGDSGVFVESNRVYPVDTLVEMRFRVHNRGETFRGLGVVRWVSEPPEHPGMGITFLKVNSLPAEHKTSASQRLRVVERQQIQQVVSQKIKPVDALRMLTRTPLHCRMLRYSYANSGQFVNTQQIASALGVGVRMLKDAIEVFERVGVLKPQDSDIYELTWPEDEALQREIVSWVSRFGLL